MACVKCGSRDYKLNRNIKTMFSDPVFVCKKCNQELVYEYRNIQVLLPRLMAILLFFEIVLLEGWKQVAAIVLSIVIFAFLVFRFSGFVANEEKNKKEKNEKFVTVLIIACFGFFLVASSYLFFSEFYNSYRFNSLPIIGKNKNINLYEIVKGLIVLFSFLFVFFTSLIEIRKVLYKKR